MGRDTSWKYLKDRLFKIICKGSNVAPLSPPCICKCFRPVPQPARMMHQMPDGNGFRKFGDIGQIFSDIIIQGNFPLFNQGRYGQSGKLL